MTAAVVTISAFDKGGIRPVTAKLGDGVPQPTGYGGWEEVKRPKRKGFPDWIAQDLMRMSLPLLLDGHAADRSVQGEVDRLEAMAAPRAGDLPPPIVYIAGPVPHTDKPWVIEDLKWGDSRRNSAGQLVRQPLSLDLLEYVESDVLVTRRRAAGGLSRTGRTWIVREGDTLMSIAARRDVLGNSRLWRRIATLNDIRDPRNLRVGQRLVLPPRKRR